MVRNHLERAVAPGVRGSTDADDVGDETDAGVDERAELRRVGLAGIETSLLRLETRLHVRRAASVGLDRRQSKFRGT
jgi:hypothetical protein